MTTLTDRQQQMYELLQSRLSLTIEEIEQQFDISTATAYRDARALVMAGMAAKSSRGVKLAPPPEKHHPEGKCAYCGAPVNNRTLFILQMKDNTQRTACCPHCGLLALNKPGVQSALASDFIYGRMVNARQAAYVWGSMVSICCEPSVICFSNWEEGRRFQMGFGGELLTLEAAMDKLNQVTMF